MTRWVLLLRAVNLGPRNKVSMAVLKELLTGLGYDDVKTYLNSGNATFRATTASAADVEDALLEQLGLSVRAVVLPTSEVAAMVDAVPDLDGYVVVSVLFDKPPRAAVKELEAWEPETVRGGKGCLYLAYQHVHGSRLTNALIEKRLGVGTTARTPATLRKLL
jgi:uncharacterized protein (DUF1697 family)